MLNFQVRKLRCIAIITLLSFVNTIVLSAHAHVATVPQTQIASSLKSLTTIENSDSEYLFKEVEYLTDDVFNGYKYFYEKLKADNYNALLDTDFIPIGVGDITIFIPSMRSMPKLIGTPFVERALIQSQLTTLIHQRWIPGYDSYEDQVKQLYTNGIRLSLSWGLKIGESVPKEKLSSIPYDIIWPEVVNVNGQQALVPVVYLSQTTLNTKIENNTVSLGSANLSFENITIDGAHIQVRRNALIKTRENFVNKNTVFEAKDIIIASGRNIENHSGTISGDKLKLIANKVVNNTLVIRHNYAMGFNDKIGSIATIKAIGDIDVDTKSDIANIGGELSAQGSIKLNAGGSIFIVPQQKTSNHEFNSEIWKLKESSLKNIPSKITAGEVLSLISEKAVLIKGSELEGKTLVEILAKLGIRILNDEDSYSYYEKYEVELEGFFSKEREFTEKQQLATTLVRSLIKSGNNIVINTKLGDIVLRAIKLESEGSTEIVAEDGAIDVQIAKEKSFYSYSSVSEGAFRFKYRGYGHNKETAFYNELFARGILRLDAAKGFRIEYAGEGSLDEIINNLSQSPELAWLKDVRSRSDINWQHVELALEEWDYKQQGLTKASAAIICIAVAVSTGGAGASLLSGVTTNSTLVAMTQAAITNIATQATVSIASGNSIGETLHNLGSKQAIKSLATSVVTAGVLDVVDSNLFNSTPTAEAGSQAATANSSVLIDIPEQSLQMLSHAIVNVSVDRLINGSAQDSFSQSLINSMALDAVNKIGATLAGKIGNAARGGKIDTAIQYILHAALGCAIGTVSASIDNDEKELACYSGAGGAVVGEFIAQQYLKSLKEDLNYKLTDWIEHQNPDMDTVIRKSKEWKRKGVDLAKLAAGITAFALKGNVDIAAQTGANAAENNALPLVWIAAVAISAAYTTYVGDGNPIEGLKEIGRGNDVISQTMGPIIDEAIKKGFETLSHDQQVLVVNALQKLSALTEAALLTADNSTGNIASEWWNSLDEETQAALKGTTIVVSSITGGGAAAKTTLKVGEKVIDVVGNAKALLKKKKNSGRNILSDGGGSDAEAGHSNLPVNETGATTRADNPGGRNIGDETGGESDFNGSESHPVKKDDPKSESLSKSNIELNRLADDFIVKLPESKQIINDMLELSKSGKIKGLGDWIEFASPKGHSNKSDLVSELREAKRIILDNPNSIVDIGSDLNPPLRKNGERMTTMDLIVEGPIVRNIEVKTIEKPIRTSKEVLKGISHAAEKAKERVEDGKPFKGRIEGTSVIELQLGKKRKGKLITDVSLDGTVKTYSLDGVERKSSNIFDSITNDLNNYKGEGVELVDSFNVVDKTSGELLALYSKNGNIWVRIK
ncbi:DUF637 domain-containing protein [Zooshikella ganghwensis]|uniref:DUF637 domain-containing protein n=1 Tax=Zooshikella ganghwensis TaxID=202772 RepID=UPI00040BE932|nr:DUF637 domain-containing protein [Zooshikella ganghwensis]